MKPAIHYAILQDAKREAANKVMREQNLRERMIRRLKATDFACPARVFPALRVLAYLIMSIAIYCSVASAIVGGHHGP